MAPATDAIDVVEPMLTLEGLKIIYDRKQFKPFAIGSVVLDAPIILAPMAGVCDAPYRVIAHRYGAALVCAEMVSSQGIRYSNQHTEELLHIEEGEHPLSMQIFGSDPEVMAQAAAVVEEAGAISSTSIWAAR